MVGKRSPEKIIKEAIANQNPAKLKKIFVPNMTLENMLILREQIGNIVIAPRFYRILFDWLSHDDTEIARAAGMLALWIRDLGFQAELFNHIARTGTLKIMFEVDYNSAEKEFSIEIPGVPGWGISYYGRDNPDIDRLLHYLEKIYIRIHPESVPTYFCQ